MPGRKLDTSRLPEGRSRKHSTQDFKGENREGGGQRGRDERQQQALAAGLAGRGHVRPRRKRYRRRLLRPSSRRSFVLRASVAGPRHPGRAGREHRSRADHGPSRRDLLAALARTRAERALGAPGFRARGGPDERVSPFGTAREHYCNRRVPRKNGRRPWNLHHRRAGSRKHRDDRLGRGGHRDRAVARGGRRDRGGKRGRDACQRRAPRALCHSGLRDGGVDLGESCLNLSGHLVDPQWISSSRDTRRRQTATEGERHDEGAHADVPAQRTGRGLERVGVGVAMRPRKRLEQDDSCPHRPMARRNSSNRRARSARHPCHRLRTASRSPPGMYLEAR